MSDIAIIEFWYWCVPYGFCTHSFGYNWLSGSCHDLGSGHFRQSTCSRTIGCHERSLHNLLDNPCQISGLAFFPTPNSPTMILSFPPTPILRRWCLLDLASDRVQQGENDDSVPPVCILFHACIQGHAQPSHSPSSGVDMPGITGGTICHRRRHAGNYSLLLRLDASKLLVLSQCIGRGPG